MILKDHKMNSSEIKAEYTSSLADLNCNSKPLINVLTMLAEENIAHAAEIVAAIEEHLAQVQTNVKLPVLYLIDSIAKNITETYTTLFSHNIVATFCSVFKMVDEETRFEMFKLRQTWNNIFPQKKLYAIDVQISLLDPAWPVTAQPSANKIHLNPKFLNAPKTKNTPTEPSSTQLDVETFAMQQKLIQKQKELIELQQKKLKLELLQTQVKLQKQIETGTATGIAGPPPHSQNILLKPEVAKQLMPEGKLSSKEKASVGGRAPRIAPVNSTLASAVKPTRDPRLLRQQNENKSSNGTNSLGSKSSLLDSNNKNVTNAKHNRMEPRLVNKDNPPTSPKSKFLKNTQKSLKQRKNETTDSKHFPKSTVINLTNSPPKSKVEVKSASKSPSRHKKKEEIVDKKKFKRYREKRSKEGSPVSFKGVKPSKNRNYIRRNRSSSFSPEPQDTDLRLTAPPEKLARIQSEEDKNIVPMDMDLRMANDKKRLSSENLENNSKKTKTQVFDALFGNEDTDLRTVLPVQVERPPTPPPPIISAEKGKDFPKKIVSDFEAVRAKLANATGRDKIMAKSFHKKHLQEDEDLRGPRPSADSLKKIIISSDDEQSIKAGTMTKQQEQQLLNKIIAQIEHQKLTEAQLMDNQDNHQSQGSDDDVEASQEKFGDKDDRFGFRNYPRERRGGPAPYWRGTKRRHWESPHPRGAVRPWAHPPSAWRPIGPSFQGPECEGSAPEAETTDMVVNSVHQDDIKSINIDGIPRDIRYYDETAVVFMDWDEPREISFQNGSRRVIFDEKDIYIMGFNEGYTDVNVNGVRHQVRLGAPSREIFIDGKPYECYFGGPGITIDLDGKMTLVKLDGPPPQVKIGSVVRDDLVAGRVNLIIDAKILVAVYLDPKVQNFVIDGETHTLKFVDALKTVLINDVPFKVEFGGLPKPITVHDKKHFIRFSVLPKGVKPGIVRIKDMEGGLVGEPDDSQESTNFVNVDNNEPALPVIIKKKKLEEEPDRNSNSPHFFQNFVNQNNLDMLSSVMSTSFSASNSDGYQVENKLPIPEKEPQKVPETLPSNLNINELFQKLVATGIVTTKEPIPEPPPKPVKRAITDFLKPVTFSKPETLKLRQGRLFDNLYAGMQCSSCGMRFPPEASIHYSQHLDWHFRQNRKGKKNIRVASSRKWYYSLSDWKNFEEIEDLEEREKNYFDQQQLQEGVGDEQEEDVETPSVPADPDVQDQHCDVCQDRFDNFFNEEKEEWHLRNAIRVEDKTYHPVCYEDYQTSLLAPPPDEPTPVIEEKTEEANIPGLETEIILDDDDDDDEPLQAQDDDDVIIEESDDSKPVEEKQAEEELPKAMEEEEDDDVIINEVVPENIEVDDDREYLDSPSTEIPVKIEPTIDDGFMDVEEGLITIKGGNQIRIKSEPIDPDEIEVLQREPTPPPATFTDTTSQPALISSIDGNIDPISSVPTTTATVTNRIKINISKSLPVIAPREPKEVPCEAVPILEPLIDPSQPLPPGEEPIQLNIKPALRGVVLKKVPPVKKGRELTGMCSIM